MSKRSFSFGLATMALSFILLVAAVIYAAVDYNRQEALGYTEFSNGLFVNLSMWAVPILAAIALVLFAMAFFSGSRDDESGASVVYFVAPLTMTATGLLLSGFSLLFLLLTVVGASWALCVLAYRKGQAQRKGVKRVQPASV